MDDVLIHLIMSEPWSQAEIDRLFELDTALDDAFPNEMMIHVRQSPFWSRLW